jgi:hypothetical protein
VGEDHCAEVAYFDGIVGLRNSQTPGSMVFVGVDGWREFIEALKSDEFRSL